MGTINQVFILGHLGADPEFQTTTSGIDRCLISVATHHIVGQNLNEKQVTWHRVKLWNHNAKVARDHLKRGDSVGITGRIVHEDWTHKNGDQKRSTFIVADRLTLIGTRSPTRQDTHV